MIKKKKSISAASSKLSSGIYVRGIYPREGIPTVGFFMDIESAKELAAMILTVCYSKNSKSGVVRITGHKKNNRITVIRPICG